MSKQILVNDSDFQASIPMWRLEGIQISREFIFKDFKEAFAFMTLCAIFRWQKQWM